MLFKRASCRAGLSWKGGDLQQGGLQRGGKPKAGALGSSPASSRRVCCCAGLRIRVVVGLGWVGLG